MQLGLDKMRFPWVSRRQLTGQPCQRMDPIVGPPIDVVYPKQPQLISQFASVYGAVTGPDGYGAGGPDRQPTRGANERTQDLNARWQATAERLHAVLTSQRGPRCAQALTGRGNADDVRSGLAPVFSATPTFDAFLLFQGLVETQLTNCWYRETPEISGRK